MKQDLVKYSFFVLQIITFIPFGVFSLTGKEFEYNLLEMIAILLEHNKACMVMDIEGQQFRADLRNFVNYPGKTTVGLAPKFTTNRKFFANLITTSAFKSMLAKDVEDVRKSIIKKMKYCDEHTLDPSALSQFYDREVDQSNI